jgi:DNA-binding transcriptional LysR family regulator
MLDVVSLDQLRTFIAAADEGSFSAAGRRLKRGQSVVSQSLSNLEEQLGVKLFDRSARFPVLTDQGRALLADARAVAGSVDLLKAHANGLAGGLEPELSIVVDVAFPITVFTGAVADFQVKFPSTRLSLYVEGWGTAVRHVLERRCAVGVMACLLPQPAQLTHERLLTVKMTWVVSPKHPLASRRAPIPTAILAEHTQLVHTDRSDIPPVRVSGILSPRTWFLAHLEAKLAFLRAGFGFGGLPVHVVEADLASGALVEIRVEDSPPWGRAIEMAALYRADSPPGPAARWLIDRLKQKDAQQLHEAVSSIVSATEHAPQSRLRRSMGRQGSSTSITPLAKTPRSVGRTLSTRKKRRR